MCSRRSGTVSVVSTAIFLEVLFCSCIVWDCEACGLGPSLLGGVRVFTKSRWQNSKPLGQDLWEIVAGSETTPPDNDQALRKWKVKAGKAMFAIKTSIEEEMLEHIRCADTPKAVWDTFATLFSKKNNVRLQLLENELMPIAQRNMAITQYFTKRRTAQGNTTAFTNQEGDSEEEWDAEASFSIIEPIEEEEMAATSIVKEDEEMALAVTNPEQVNYREDWIVDSRCSNHMTGDKEKLQNMSKYKGKRVVVTANNTKLPIAHIGETLISPRFNAEQVPLEQVYHVHEVKKNLLSVAQLVDLGNWVLFGLKYVKVYKEIVVIGTPMMEGQQMESIYVMSAESAYVDKTRKNETVDLWHARLGHVSYHKLKESKFSVKEPLELVHSSKAMEEIQIFENEGEPESRGITQSPCQTNVHQWKPKEDRPRLEEVIEKEESPQPQLRRSMRHHKANHRYANAILTKDQVADILTKVLSIAKFQKATWNFDPGGIERESVLRGSVKNQAPPLSL
uniref:Retrovirus-related Pol polyprotein from transposon TNT 1-94-like beta-barrel domain-containing protein n=1 Tax=Fagus sylvatica TaxID=28930 RepID=A0A2N9EMD7_FAGSY